METGLNTIERLTDTRDQTGQKIQFLDMKDAVAMESREGQFVRNSEGAFNVETYYECEYAQSHKCGEECKCEARGLEKLRDEEQDLVVEFVISSFRRDDYGTRFDPRGADLSQYKRNPIVLYRHMRDSGIYTLPIAKGLVESMRIDAQGLVRMKAKFTPEKTFPFGYQVYKLVREGYLNMASIGAQVMSEEIMEEENGQKTIVFREWKLFEWSVVPIGANDDAVVVGREKAAVEEVKRDANKVTSFFNEKKTENKEREERKVVSKEKSGLWNRDLPESFDVSEVELPPSEALFDMVSKHLTSEVKNVFHNSVHVPSARIGSFLRALKEEANKYELVDVRNMNHVGGESPPVYEVIRLTSKQSDDFLVQGVSFYGRTTSENRFVTRITPVWGGMQLDVFTSIDDKQRNRDFVDGVWKEAVENNLLRGECFSISGEFIPETRDTWEDVILSEKNKSAMKSNTERLTKKGADCPNRGVILMGQPGTGKTMSGRIIRNTCECTFIWLSARDFMRMGSRAVVQAFQLSRELAPAVVFMEDIDNWLDRYMVDFFKTEMDGIARSSGVMTILTTNYPERLPDALIDRPGRFHDVLHFDAPDATCREEMVKRWVEDATEDDVQLLVKKTVGYSGAHMYELASFIKNIREAEDVELSEAISRALEKLDEQKKLIGSVRNTISRDLAGDETEQQRIHREYFEEAQPVLKQYRSFMEKVYKRIGIVPPKDEETAIRGMAEMITPTNSTEAPKAEGKKPEGTRQVTRDAGTQPSEQQVKDLTARIAVKVETRRRQAVKNGMPVEKSYAKVPEWTQEELKDLSFNNASS